MSDGRTRIELCGTLSVKVAGRQLAGALPGRQGRLLFAYLVLNREHPVDRDRLVAVLWPDRAPADPKAALNVLISRLRRTLRPLEVDGSHGLLLQLGVDAHVDVEVAAATAARAEAALAARRFDEAVERAQAASEMLRDPLLPGLNASWLDEARRERERVAAVMLETLAESALALGSHWLPAAERAAEALVQTEPYRESGYALLMRCHAARGNVAEGLRVFDRLRSTLREELGVVPAPSVRALGERFLRGEMEKTARSQRAFRPLPEELRREPRTPLVGRDAELDRLLGWTRSPDAARIACVAGEPGIGKTRLAAQLARRLHGDQVAVLYGGSDPDAGLPYQPLVAVLRQLLEHRPIEELPVELAPELAELSHLLPELRPRVSQVPRRDGDDAELRRHRLFEAVTSLLAEEARERRVLVVVDDLQWADGPTRSLLRYVLRSPRTVNVRVLALFRAATGRARRELADLLSEAMHDDASLQIELTTLDAGPVEELALHVLGADTSPAMLDAICTQTGGHPLFLTETLAALRDAADSASRAPSVEDLRALGVPEGIRAVVVRRIAALGPETESALRLAAVVGLRFRVEVLEALLDDHIDALATLERASAAGIVFELEPVGTFRFGHVIVRDTLAGELSRTRRVRLHCRIGEVLETLGAPPAERAHHWLAGGRRERAHANSVAAAREAAAGYAFDQAFALYEQALNLSDGDPDPDLYAAAADAARWAGDPQRAVAHVRAALVAIPPSDHVRAALLQERLGRFLWEMGEWDGSLAAYAEATRRLPDSPPSRERARALGSLATTLMLRERYLESASHSAEALAVARAVGARAEEADALNTLGVDLANTGRLEHGLGALRQALAIARDLNDLEALCRAYTNLSEVLARAGRTREALEVALDGVGLARDSRILATGGAIVTANAMAAFVKLGRWDEAEALSEEVLGMGVPEGLASELRALRISLHVARGDIDRAREELPAAAAAGRNAYEPSVLVTLQVARAELALLEGEHEAAHAAIGAHIDRLAGDSLIRLCAAGLLVEAVRGDGVERAAALIASARAAASELGEALLPEAAAQLATAEAEYGRIAGDEQPLAWQAAAEAWERLGHPYAAARSRMREAAALASRGAYEQARKRLESAHAVARRLGAKALLRDIERVGASAAHPTS